MMELLEKIRLRKAIVGIIGLGYVGLPLAALFSRKGFKVIGFDTDLKKVDALKAGKTYIRHIPDLVISDAVKAGFAPTIDFSRSTDCDAILICVPTPLTVHREPDMTYVTGSCETIAPHLRKGQIIILESTTYPGTTDEVMRPILERGGLKADRDFWLAYSPEREDPNNARFDTSTIPKVVGADTGEGLEIATALYDQVIVEVIPVSSTRVAEACKILENTFRAVNIALVNELKTVFTTMGIDVWEVIEAASTKPFGFMKFTPGPGLGGHCIPIDPFYLTWKAHEHDVSSRFIEMAGEVNTSMPRYVVQRTMEAFSDSNRGLNGSSVLLVGLSYKKNVDDARESPSFKLMELLRGHGADVSYHDPYIPVIPSLREYPDFEGWESVSLDRAGEFDAVLIATDHDCIDWERLRRDAKMVVDTRGIYKGKNDNVIKA